MPLSEEFEQAQTRVRKLARTPDSGDLLELYALYKQGTAGEVTGKRPGALDFKGRAKYDAWARKSGLSRDDAMLRYVELVAALEQKYA